MANDRWILAATGLLLGVSGCDLSAASSTVPRQASPYTIDVWDREDGLPQNSVIAMTQTRDGYLWLGTLDGLARFDGIRFTPFNEVNTPGLGSSRIVHLFEDSKTNLWIGTETAGVAVIRKGQVQSLDIGRGSREGRLVSACEDSNGAVWLYTADGQLCRYRNGQVDVWKFGADDFSSFRAVVDEKSGPMWVGMDWGLYGMGSTTPSNPRDLPLEQVLPAMNKLDFVLASARGGYWRLAGGRVEHWRTNRLEPDLGPYPWTSNARVSSACEDREGNLIVGTLNEGVFWYGPDGKATQISTAQGLSHDGVLSVCVDREGCLWVGTDGGGLNRVKRKVFSVAQASRGWVVQSVSADSQGGLWMGFNASWATYWNRDVVRDYGPEQGWMNVWSVFVDRSERVWTGTLRGGLWRLGEFQLRTNRFQLVPGSEIADQDIFAIHQDRKGVLWAGTQGGLARWDEHVWKVVFTTRDGLPANDVRALADDAEGNLWIGTGKGLGRLREGQFTSYRKQASGLPSDDISSLFVDRAGALWVGTRGSGLVRFRDGKWTCYTTSDGLAGNSIAYLIEDDQGCLWIGSNAGLTRVPNSGGLPNFAAGRVYGKPDGLPTRECTQGSQPAACRTRDGRLWFPTIKGLVSVNPEQIRPNTNPPPVMIESVLVQGQEQNTNPLCSDCLQTVTVPPGKERLEIQFTSLNLAAPDRARFKYQLAGHEAGWTEVPAAPAGRAPVARYPSLPPRQYRFHVTACNEDGVWNEAGRELAVVVLPQFWQTWWFRGAILVCLLGCLVAAVYYVSTQKLQRQLERLRHQEALERERARIARDIHDQVGASLTQVSLLGELLESDKESPGEVEAHARQISQTARETTRALDEIVWTVNPSNDTLDGLITYVCKYAQEYFAVAGLQYRLDVPAQLPSATISPEVRHNVFLAAKEAITNVVRHAHASSVWVRLRVEPAAFVLEIEDNGRGLAGMDEKAARSRNGLGNMRKRMEDIGGSFVMGSGSGGGTRVRLTAPLGNV